MALIANKIPKHDKNIFFFIDKTKKEKFNLNNNIKKHYFKNNSSNQLNKLFKNKLLKNSNVIFSDNLLHKKFIFKKTILFANFFWEEILNKNKENLKIFKSKNIKIFSNYLFSNIKTKIIIKSRFFEKYKPSKNDSILISTGTANSRLFKNLKQIIKLLKINPLEKKIIFRSSFIRKILKDILFLKLLIQKDVFTDYFRND